MRRPVTLALTLALLSACSSPTTSEKGAAAGKNAMQAATYVEQGIGELDATLAALKALVKSPAPDLKPQYKTFDKSLSSLESTAKEVSAIAAKIDENSKVYFAQWDEQIAGIQNEDIRERGVERREAVAAGFSKLQEEYVEVREEFKPLLDNLRDVRTVLSTDLTMDGLKSIEDTVEDIADSSKDVRESLQSLGETFKKLGVRLEQRGPVAEKAAAAK
jgi:DUF2959 family protein